MFENYSKMSHLNFCAKNTLLIFGAISNVNIARFARNVEWDFFVIFKQCVYTYNWNPSMAQFSCGIGLGSWPKAIKKARFSGGRSILTIIRWYLVLMVPLFHHLKADWSDSCCPRSHHVSWTSCKKQRFQNIIMKGQTDFRWLGQKLMLEKVSENWYLRIFF